LKLSPTILRGALIVLLSACACAQTLTGTVTNGTTKKPAAGDEVILIKLGSGMEEVANTRTDAQGKFTFKLPDAGMPHLVRVVHQDVTYHHMAPPGTASADVDVYDVAKKVDGISVTADVMRMQTGADQLEVARLFALNNQSSPPRTQMKDANFEFYLPDGAQIAGGMALTANGQWINSEPIPQRDKNRYAFSFPLRPGETQFQVNYQLPYSGSAQFEPKLVYPLEHFVVMIPKSMQFTAVGGAAYQGMDDPQQRDATVEVAQNVQPGQSLEFKLAGTGTISAGNSSDSGGETAQGGMGGADTRPGGGLGPPIDAPDPLQRYRWYILGGFAALLVAGAIFVSSRQGLATAPAGRGASVAELDLPPSSPAVSAPVHESRAKVPAPASAAPAAPTASRSLRPMILDALKEELFELELEHKQGKITQGEYEKAKAALDATLERALKREAQKV
jgi:hypothetical protein